MASFKVTCDVDTGLVNCKFSGFVSDADAEELVEELTRAIHAARRRYGPLRMLIDNRDGTVFSTSVTASVAVLKSVYDQKDRIAVIVPTGLRKLQAQRNVSDQTCIFLTEDEAMNWLRSARDEVQIG